MPRWSSSRSCCRSGLPCAPTRARTRPGHCERRAAPGDQTRWAYPGLQSPGLTPKNALVMWVAPALLFVDLGASIALKATGRRGIYAPLLGCATHVVFVGISLHMTSLAGPLN